MLGLSRGQSGAGVGVSGTGRGSGDRGQPEFTDAADGCAGATGETARDNADDSEPTGSNDSSRNLLGRLGNALRGATSPIRQRWSEHSGHSTIEVVGRNQYLQDRITRSRLAGEPPDVMLLPHVSHIGLLEYHRADDAIAAGRACVQHGADAITTALELPLSHTP